MKTKSTTRILFILALLLLPALLRADQIWALGRRYISVSDLAARYNLKVTDRRSQVELTGNGQRLVLFPDKRYAMLNGISHTLSFAPLRRGKLYLSSLDMTTSLDPVLGKRSVPRHPIRTIVIDPGHGGKDQGASNRYREKEITLRLAYKLRTLLQRAGYKVVLTRTGDSYVTLSRRAAIARTNRADLFISLHVNATRDRGVRGIETYVMTPAKAPSSTAKYPDDDAYPGNRTDLNNQALGYWIQKYLLRKTDAEDRGLKRARFQVLREVTCPAVLVEVGFISNRPEESKLVNNSYQDALMRGVADGVLQYHRALLRK